jgi:CubicO group peptidase (beta-lactamase class C family)
MKKWTPHFAFGSLINLLAIVLLIAGCAPASLAVPTAMVAPSPTAGDAQEKLDGAKLTELETYIVQSMELAKIPGMSIAVIQNGNVVYIKGFGVRNLGEHEAVTPDTLMMIGSSTKPLTTMMMATVVDNGLMKWDTPVTSILPSFAVASTDLTRQLEVQHLVCACSGMPGEDSALFLSKMDTAEDLFRSMRKIAPVSGLGEKFNYSNQMVAAGGYIASVAAGGPKDDLTAGYITAMQQRIFDPIGMAATTFSVQQVQASNNYALPHGLNLERNYQPLDISAEKFVSSIMPAGGAWSTAHDMSRLLITLLNQGISPDGSRVVSVENLSKTWEPKVDIEKGSVSYGLGWILENYHGMRMIHHSGNSMGFSAELAFLPTNRLGVVILTNAESAGDFISAIRSRLFEITFGYPYQYDAIFTRSLVASQNGIANFAKSLLPGIDVQVISPYLGNFTNEKLGEINLHMEDSRLILSTSGLASELRQLPALGENTFVVYDVPWAILGQWTFQFETDSQNKPTIALREKGVTQPFMFMKTGEP